MIDIINQWCADHPFRTFGFTGLGLYWLYRSIWGAGSKKVQVAKIIKNFEDTYQSNFRWERIELETIRKNSNDYYDTVLNEMKAIGFDWKGDVEFLNVTEANPALRTGLRIFNCPKGTVSAACYNLKGRGWTALTMKLSFGRSELKVTDFETKLTDGRWIMTTNMGNSSALTEAPEILKYNHPHTMGTRQLFQLHLANVRQHLSVPNPPGLVTAYSLEELMILSAEQHALKARHRAGTDTVTEKELEKLCPEMTPSQRRSYFEEFQRQNAAANTKAQA